jgi:hypothetical protein
VPADKVIPVLDGDAHADRLRRVTAPPPARPTVESAPDLRARLGWSADDYNAAIAAGLKPDGHTLRPLTVNSEGASIAVFRSDNFEAWRARILRIADTLR